MSKALIRFSQERDGASEGGIQVLGVWKGMEFSSSYLLELRRKALRRRVWFRVLDRAERAILTLVPRCVDIVKSRKLLRLIENIVAKINEALRSRVERFKDRVGKPLAQKLSQIARRWGNESARDWAEDERFIQYLTIVKMNEIPIFR